MYILSASAVTESNNDVREKANIYKTVKKNVIKVRTVNDLYNKQKIFSGVVYYAFSKNTKKTNHDWKQVIFLLWQYSGFYFFCNLWYATWYKDKWMFWQTIGVYIGI